MAQGCSCSQPQLICRAALYDDQILDWIKHDLVQAEELADDAADMAEFSRHLLAQCAPRCAIGVSTSPVGAAFMAATTVHLLSSSVSQAA